MSRRSAFTLVELLVVAAIMAVFFGLIVNGANPGSGSQVRQAAQSLASVLTAAQSRALGSPAGAAVIFESGTATPGLPAVACITVSNGDLPPFISGTTADGLSFPLTSTSAPVTLGPTNGDAADLVHAYKVQFGGGLATVAPVQPISAWYTLACPAASGNSASCTASFRSTEGQTDLNTIWPEPLRIGGVTVPMAFRAARYPVKADVAMQCGKAAAIDLRFSGVGDDPTTTWGGLAGPGREQSKGAIALVFDSVGGVDALMQQVLKAGSRTADPAPIDPSDPIYLLVAPRDDVRNDRSLASPQAVWLVIHPQTGRVSLAGNVPQSGTDATALRAARAKARAGVVFGK